MRVAIVVGLSSTLAFGGCATQNRWPGPPPAPLSSPSITSGAFESVVDEDAAVPVYGDTHYKPPPEEPLPVDPNEQPPEEPTVEKSYDIR